MAWVASATGCLANVDVDDGACFSTVVRRGIVVATGAGEHAFGRLEQSTNGPRRLADHPGGQALEIAVHELDVTLLVTQEGLAPAIHSARANGPTLSGGDHRHVERDVDGQVDAVHLTTVGCPVDGGRPAHFPASVRARIARATPARSFATTV